MPAAPPQMTLDPDAFASEAFGPLYARDVAAPPAGSRDLQRRSEALDKWRRRSRQVRFFRRALPAAIVAILLFGAAWIGGRALVSALAKGEARLGSIHLLKPDFYGRNEHGELYIMSAAEAVRLGEDPDRISLVQPRLKQYPVGAPEPMTTRAERGVYHQARKLLDLYGRVVATDGRGYTFTSDYAHVDMPRNSATGNAHVYAYGPSGSISADAYQVYDKGSHAIFTGHVRTHLTNHTPPKAPVQPAARPVLPADAQPLPFQVLKPTAR